MSCDPKTCPEISGHISCSDIISTEIAARAHCAAIFRTGAMLTLEAWNRGGEGGEVNKQSYMSNTNILVANIWKNIAFAEKALAPDSQT